MGGVIMVVGSWVREWGKVGGVGRRGRIAHTCTL